MDTAVEAVRTRIGSGLRLILGGSEEPRQLPDDGGLFGPDSATWRVHGDASMLVGGIRALIIQTLHPPTMAGVAEHSNYKSDPLGRLQRTAQFLSATTFGTVAVAESAIATVRAVHGSVNGVMSDGTEYSANDPHLLLWVHCTEVDSFLVAKRRYGSGSIDDTTADRYVEEMATVGEMLGVIDAPRDQSQLAECLNTFRDDLGITSDAQRALWFITFAPLPITLRAPYGILLGGAVATLPSWARRQLCLPRLPITEALAVRPAALTLTRLLAWSLAAPQPRPR
ncbi:MAG: oxygenase MpaB family protein, partial [Acidimicrobiales bacterium]